MDVALNHSGKCGFGERINWFCMDGRPICVKRKMYVFKNIRIRDSCGRGFTVIKCNVLSATSPFLRLFILYLFNKYNLRP